MTTIHKISRAGLVACLVTSAHGATTALNDLAIDFTSQANRGGGDFAPSTVATFQVEDSALSTANTDLVLQPGNNGFTDLNGTTVGSYTFTSSTTAASGLLSSFSAQGSSHNDETPISDTYVFGANGSDPTATAQLIISGLAAEPAGSTLTLTLYGIGDNVGQQSSFTGTLGTQTFTAETAYNAVGEARSSNVGSIPFVQFNFTTDGTDDLVIDITRSTASNASNFAINGLSLSATAAVVPEPSSTALLGLGGLALFIRRRR